MKHIICTTLVLLLFASIVQAAETPVFTVLTGHTNYVHSTPFSPGIFS